MLPAGQDAAEAFYRITDAAYERRSVGVTSNIHPDSTPSCQRPSPPRRWTTAAADAHLVIMKGTQTFLG
jgi:hypothetical protein